MKESGLLRRLSDDVLTHAIFPFLSDSYILLTIQLVNKKFTSMATTVLLERSANYWRNQWTSQILLTTNNNANEDGIVYELMKNIAGWEVLYYFAFTVAEPSTEPSCLTKFECERTQCTIDEFVDGLEKISSEVLIRRSNNPYSKTGHYWKVEKKKTHQYVNRVCSFFKRFINWLQARRDDDKLKCTHIVFDTKMRPTTNTGESTFYISVSVQYEDEIIMTASHYSGYFG